MTRPGPATLFAAGLAGVLLLYATAIVVGLHVHDMSKLTDVSTYEWGSAAPEKMAWQTPSLASIPDGPEGESIRRGLILFTETPLYASANARARVSCSGCHAEGGMQPYASPMVGVPATFPQFNARAGHVISLKDRIQECFVRSENGQPIDYDGPAMKALVDYIDWLSQPEAGHKAFTGRGLVTIADLNPDPVRGQAIYAQQCAGCHGQNGEGRPHVFPPLWGPDSFNDGAGMHGIKKMAAFVKHNMPQNRMGMLSEQDAWDVSAFIHQQPRPAFDKQYAHF